VIITVAISGVSSRAAKKGQLCKYSDVPRDEYGWVYDLKYRPIPYDLMYLKIEGLPERKTGWWNGATWEGRKLKKGDKIIAWKRNNDFE
jgi:hypothetical protein